ncbi:MAG: shikimate dehydrogenase [Sphingobacteriales bacterium]|nr:MAG: shikimate dehydrogenase [Sphingobacteriales bacterium]
MPAYGLIGYPLSHSFSPGYFKAKFQKEALDATYKLFPIPTINFFPDLLQQYPELNGLNVTIPYKESVIPYLHSVDETAAKVGAVNCIKINNGITKGFNTDVIGFRESLIPLLQPWQTGALILGTGGASLAVAFVLKELGINYQFVSRHAKGGSISYDQLTAEHISGNKLIINTTPQGMYPDVSECPDIPYHVIDKGHLLYDLIYNPTETLFLAKGREQGAVTKNGLEMLELQAEASWQIWNDPAK